MLWLVYITSFMMIGFALMLVATNQPVRSVLCLIGCFLCATIHWILLDAEFLALALIFVYIGAVMTLFLFMVMMLNVDSYAPEYRLGLATFFVLITFSLLLPSFGFYLWDAHLSSSAWDTHTLVAYPLGYDNTKAIGAVLYTEYVYPLQLIAMLLLLAILVAVGWVHRAKRDFVRVQKITDQIKVTKGSRLRLVGKGDE